MDYKINLLDHIFVAQVELVDEDNEGRYYEIHIGGRSRKCCRFLVDPHAKVVTLVDFYYNSNCRAFTGLSEGYGTKVLLYAGILFVNALWPECRVLQLQDESHKKVTSFDGRTGLLSLTDWNLLVYGKTWYQRALPGLTFASDMPSQSRTLPDLLQLLQRTSSPTFKTETGSIDDFLKATMIGPDSSHMYRKYIKTDQSLLALIRGAFDKSRTLQEFFGRLDKLRKMHDGASQLILQCLPHWMTYLGLASPAALHGSVWQVISISRLVQTLNQSLRDSLTINSTEEFNGLSFRIKQRVYPRQLGDVVSDAHMWNTHRNSYLGTF